MKLISVCWRHTGISSDGTNLQCGHRYIFHPIFYSIDEGFLCPGGALVTRTVPSLVARSWSWLHVLQIASIDRPTKIPFARLWARVRVVRRMSATGADTLDNMGVAVASMFVCCDLVTASCSASLGRPRPPSNIPGIFSLCRTVFYSPPPHIPQHQ